MDKETITAFTDTTTAPPSKTNTYIYTNGLVSISMTCQICGESFPVPSTSSMKVICPSCATKIRKLIGIISAD